MPTDTPDGNDKSQKMHGTEIDISNGALFLRIVALEREAAWLRRRLSDIEPKVNHAFVQTAQIGGAALAVKGDGQRAGAGDIT